MRTVTVKGGPLHGKRYDVHPTATTLDPHPAAPNGQYVIRGTTAVWTPDKDS